MRKLCVLLFLGIFLLSTGCISSKPTAPTPTQETYQPGLATKTSQITPVIEPLEWGVDILQNEKVISVRNREIELDREPFTIRVRLPVFLNVNLNVFDKDTNLQRIIPGFVFPEYCDVAFCPGMGIAEDNKSTSLVVDIQGTHYLYYLDDKSNRWSRISIEYGEVVLDRDVAFLNQKPISETTYRRLYMVFLVNYRENYIVNDDEVNQVILLFR
jgi:hypothetical protein